MVDSAYKHARPRQGALCAQGLGQRNTPLFDRAYETCRIEQAVDHPACLASIFFRAFGCQRACNLLATCLIVGLSVEPHMRHAARNDGERHKHGSFRNPSNARNSKGTVLLDGQNIENYTRNDLRSRIGVGPQKAALFKGSIRDNLKWGREDASDEDLWQALTTAQGKEVVEGKPGQLDFMLEQNGKNLSGGQKQRLTIARALVKKPEILILDDSASALDFATDAALRKSLNRLDWKVTTFLVSQRSSSIQQADLILVLDNGTLAGKGTHAELLHTCDTYREIYFSQFPEERDKYASVSADNIMKEVTV